MVTSAPALPDPLDALPAIRAALIDLEAYLQKASDDAYESSGDDKNFGPDTYEGFEDLGYSEAMGEAAQAVRDLLTRFKDHFGSEAP